MLGNKTAFITGASRGIGKAIAALFAVEGYNVAIMCSSSQRELEETERELNIYTPNVLALMGDVGEYKAARTAVEEIERKFGCIDVLVNNAGISYVGLFNTMQPTQWKRVIDTNLNGVLNCTHAAVQNMIRTHRGNIINISSMWGELGASCEAVYSATIRVNAIACGVIDTRMNSFLKPSERMALQEEIPLRRFGNPEEVARLALYLAENDSAYITGQIISIDGGMS